MNRLGFGRLHTTGLTSMTGKALEMAQSLTPKVQGNFTIALCGDRGTGKTQIATYLAAQIPVSCNSIGWESIAHARVPRYYCAHDLMQAIRGEFSGIREQCLAATQILSEAKLCALLVIDEFSELTGSDYNKRTLTNLIDARYRDMRPTIIITNTNPEAVGGEVGRSIYDRCCESGGIVDCSWSSYRTKPN